MDNGAVIRTKEGSRRQPPLWTPHLPEIDGRWSLTFLDLMEIRIVKRLTDQEKGMKLPRIREALIKYRECNTESYPLLNKKLLTDRKYLFEKSFDKAGKPLLNLNKWQYVFETFVAPTLDSVDLGDDELPYRWWPKGKHVPIVLDPSHAFGDPTLTPRGVTTSAIARAVAAESSIDRVARLYRVDVEDVRAAVEFEADLAARRLAA